MLWGVAGREIAVRFHYSEEPADTKVKGAQQEAQGWCFAVGAGMGRSGRWPTSFDEQAVTMVWSAGQDSQGCLLGNAWAGRL